MYDVVIILFASGSIGLFYKLVIYVNFGIAKKCVANVVVHACISPPILIICTLLSVIPLHL